jgi:hypothetical protein
MSAALRNFKKLYEVVGEQSKALKLTIERKKDEEENLHNAIREMQA